MTSFARDHIADLVSQDRVLYGRACALVLHACKAWRCSVDHLLGYERSPQMDQVRSALTLVAREQCNLSNSDLTLVLARNDSHVIGSRIKSANAAIMRRLDPIYSAYWSLVGHLRRSGFPLQGRPSIAEREEEQITLDLTPYLTRPEGTITAAYIKHTVCTALELEESEVMSNLRNRKYADARTFSFVFMRGELGFSFPQIAQAMKKDSHSTVHTACKRFIAVHAEDSTEANDYRGRFALCCEALGVDPSTYPAKLLEVSQPRSAPDTPTRTHAGSPGRAPDRTVPLDDAASGNTKDRGLHFTRTNMEEGAPSTHTTLIGSPRRESDAAGLKEARA